MTHIENIPHILKKGITHQNSTNSNKNYISIGYKSLILKRETFKLFNGKMLGSYIPFYFGARMPMLYVIMLGSSSVKYDLKPTSSEDIVYCITSIEQIVIFALEFIFSNGHAVSDLTEFYDKTQIENIHNLIDQGAIDKKHWIDENDLDLKRRKEAEFLVEDDIPIEAVLGFAVFNDNAKRKLLEYGVPDNKIVIRPIYYF